GAAGKAADLCKGHDARMLRGEGPRGAPVVLCVHGERAWAAWSAILPRAPCTSVAAGAAPRSGRVAPRSWRPPEPLPGPRSPGAEDLSLCDVGLLDGVWRCPGAMDQASTHRLDALLPGAGDTPGPLAGAGPGLGQRKGDVCR